MVFSDNHRGRDGMIGPKKLKGGQPCSGGGGQLGPGSSDGEGPRRCDGEGRGDKEGEGRALWACDGVVGGRADSNALPMGGAYERDGAGLVHEEKEEKGFALGVNESTGSSAVGKGDGGSGGLVTGTARAPPE